MTPKILTSRVFKWGVGLALIAALAVGIATSQIQDASDKAEQAKTETETIDSDLQDARQRLTKNEARIVQLEKELTERGIPIPPPEPSSFDSDTQKQSDNRRDRDNEQSSNNSRPDQLQLQLNHRQSVQ